MRNLTRRSTAGRPLLTSVFTPNPSRRSSKGLGAVEVLESRIAPATFTGAAGVLTIDLTNIDEAISLSHNGSSILVSIVNGTAVDGGGTGGNVLGFTTNTATITSAAFTAINITDSATGTDVTFAESTGVYTEAFTITLNNAGSGNIIFTGNSTFDGGLSASTTSGFIASDFSANTTFANLSLSAANHDILMKGRLSVVGATNITGNVIELSNPANDFIGALQLSAPVVSKVVDVNDLILGASSFGFGALDQTTRISAGGSITQTGALTATGTGTLLFSSTTASIALTDAGNNVGANVAVGFSVTGANNVGYLNTAGILLANVDLETGALTLSSNGSILQDAGTKIETGGAVSLNITGGANRDITLNFANRIDGTISVTESGGGDLRDFTLRNLSETATFPAGTPFTTADDIRNLTLTFDNSPLLIPAATVSGDIVFTAGGAITQTAPIDAGGGDSTITLLGDYPITLTNPSNTFGRLSINAQTSTQPIQVTSAADLDMNAWNVGRSALTVSALDGEITQSGALIQAKGAEPATFAIGGAGNNSIDLNNAANRITGTVNFVGTGLSDLNIRNADFQAQFDQFLFPASVNDLTVRFDNASIALPSITIADLDINALGIVQKEGSTLNISAKAKFTGNNYPVVLANALNDFTDLEIDNTGRNDVIVTEVDGFNFTGTSALGTGRFIVTTSGSITQTNNSISQQNNGGPWGEVLFTSTGGSISLNQTNSFRGTFSASVTGTNTLSVTNGVSLTLGVITTGTGAFSATASGLPILQDPTSILTFGGASSFTMTNLTLLGFENTFTGAVSLNGTSASIRSTGPVILGTSNLTGTLFVKTPGEPTDSVTQNGAITGGSAATFDVGAGNITLTLANNFSSVSAHSTGTSVAITDTNALNIGTMVLGGGTLTLTTGGNLGTAGGGSLTQTTGTGTITLDTPMANNITLDSNANSFLGQVNVLHSTNVAITNSKDLAYVPTSSITGAFNSVSGGTLTLPSNVNVTSFTANATDLPIGVNITASNSINLIGNIQFIGDRMITAGSTVTIGGDVNVGGDLTFTAGAAQNVSYQRGLWLQGDHALTINGAGSGFNIGTALVAPAEVQITSGTINMPGGGTFRVDDNGTLTVGLQDTPEIVTVANGSGSLVIAGTLQIGFGDTNDQLIKTGDGIISILPGARLWGQGLAGDSATPVLVSQTALITGRFLNSVETDDTARDFFAGSDVVTPTYDFTSLSIQAGGTEAPGGSFTGFLPDGDKYTVKSSLGGGARLVVVEDLFGRLGIVTRNDAGSASTLTITAGGGGDGIIPVSGVMIHSTGKATISASASDFNGTIHTAGPLGALTARNLIGDSTNMPLHIADGGTESGKTSITARVISQANFELSGALNSLKAVSVDSSVNIWAYKFGSITTTGEPASTDPFAPGFPNPGNFNAHLVNTNPETGVALSSAKIKGILSGIWDLNGSVGSVTATETSSWSLGLLPGGSTENGGLLTSVSSLNLGEASNSSVNATGALNSLIAVQLDNVSLTANSFGTIKVSADSKRGFAGHVSELTLKAWGNAGGVALKGLTVAGNMTDSNFTFMDGDASSIVVNRGVFDSMFLATDINNHGNFKSITAGDWENSDIDARSIGTMKIVGNLPAGFFGDFSDSIITVRSNTSGSGLGTFDAKGDVSGSTFDVQSGNLKTFKVGRELSSTTVRLTDPNFGTLTTIQAGDWLSGVNIVAETIGTISSVGAPAAFPDSNPLSGSFNGTNITAYLNSGTAVGIGKVNAKGDMSGTRINSEMGITSLIVGRTIGSSTIIADDSVEGASKVGRIQTLTAGAIDGSTIVANTLGTTKVIGAPLPDAVDSWLFGDVNSSTLIAHGTNSPAKPVGMDQLMVSGFVDSSTVIAPFGIKAITVAAGVVSTRINATNPDAPADGTIGTLTVGELYLSNVHAGRITTLKVTGNTPFEILGNVANSTIAVNAGATVENAPEDLKTMTVAGDFLTSFLDAPASVGKVQVTGRIVGGEVNAGYAETAKLTSLTAGALGQASTLEFTRVVSNSIGTLSLTGNAKRGFTGTMDNVLIDILGNSAGMGLKTFTANGTATNSLIRVSDGDVGSFTVQRFISTELLVGFRMADAGDITAMTNATNWSTTNHKIGSFTTTAPFDPEDDDSDSFVDSNVIAALLGSINISGVSEEAIIATANGVAFRASATTPGVVKVNGGPALVAPAVLGDFNYLGLLG